MAYNAKQLLQHLRPRRGLLTFGIFLVLSSLCWLSTALNGYYDYEVDVPILYDNMPDNVIPTTDDVAIVRVTLHDKGFALLKYTLRQQVSPLVIDYQAFLARGNTLVVAPAELHKLIAKKFPASTAISALKPDRIDCSYVAGVAKSVPVRLDGDCTPSTNYYLEHTAIEPSHVTVYAEKDKIDSIRYVVTERLQVSDFADTLCQEVRIKHIPNTKTSPDHVSITLYPDVLTEDVARVPITAIHVPEGIDIKLFPRIAEVRYTVGASVYRQVDPSQFVVTLDYNNIHLDTTHCVITITQTPHEVKQATLARNEVEYLIEKQ